jgi:hypothetical protein
MLNTKFLRELINGLKKSRRRAKGIIDEEL